MNSKPTLGAELIAEFLGTFADGGRSFGAYIVTPRGEACLLYTSDAADE